LVSVVIPEPAPCRAVRINEPDGLFVRGQKAVHGIRQRREVFL